MSVLKPRYSKQEFAHRGKEIYQRDILPHIRPEDTGKFVAIDIETGMYVLDEDDYTAVERLLSQRPDAQSRLMRVGERAAYRTGRGPVARETQ
jgi:hypothetical protein